MPATTQHTPFCKACDAPLDAAKAIGRKNGYDFLPCPHCGTVTVDPFPTLDQLTAYYQSYRGTKMYRTKSAKKIIRSRRRVARLIGLTAGTRFLDVGCNYGLTVKAALDLGLDAKGIDIDKDTVAEGRQMLGADNRLEAVSVEAYAAQGNKADIVYTSEVIEHVHSPDAFMQAISALLDKDGVLYLTTPQAGHWMVPKDFAKYRSASPPLHITYFPKKGITLLLKRHGFGVPKFVFSLFKPGIRLTVRKL